MNLRIAIVAYEGLWERLIKLISNENLVGEDLKIYSSEDPPIGMDQSEKKTKQARWGDDLECIRSLLIGNLMRLDRSIKIGEDEIPQWMAYRELKKGDKSVMFKHYKACEEFLESKDDYLMVMEDDAIFARKGVIQEVKSMISVSKFDYYDIAGGDNLKCNEDRIITINGIEGEIIESRASRTACCYVVSREAASYIKEEIGNLVMPIDWAISVALTKMPENSKVFWCNTKLMVHGTSAGIYESWRK